MNYLGLSLPTIHGVEENSVLSRFPVELNRLIGHNIAHNLYAFEIRLIPKSEIKIHVRTLDDFPETKYEIFHGDLCERHEVCFKEETTIIIEKPEKKNPLNVISESKYDPQIIRIIFLCKSLIIDAIEGDFISDDSLFLDKRILVYGTSLSMGSSTHLAYATYPWLLGRMLEMEVDNYALAGKCFLEKEVIDFLSKLPYCYDLIILEPCTNLLAQGVEIEEFKKRCKYLFDTMLNSYKKAHIICINLFESLFDHGLNGEFKLNNKPEEYRQALEEICCEYDKERLKLVDSFSLLKTCDLSSDLLHPSSLGYFRIATSLYSQIKDFK